MQSIYQYAWLIPTLPCLASATVGLSLLVVREATRSQRLLASGLIITALSVAMLLSVITMCQQVSSHSAHCELWSWISVGALSFNVGYLVDPLSAIMLVLVTTVGVMVMIYASGYMLHDEGYVRFFVYLSLFTASMLALILSPNLVQIYVFWELVGMCSYLLIGFWFTRSSASYASQKAFVTNRIGDFSLLLGIFGVYWLTGSVEFNTIGEVMHTVIRSDPKQMSLVNVCCLLLFFGPIAKSAQFPLHVWLADGYGRPNTHLGFDPCGYHGRSWCLSDGQVATLVSTMLFRDGFCSLDRRYHGSLRCYHCSWTGGSEKRTGLLYDVSTGIHDVSTGYGFLSGRIVSPPDSCIL